MHDPDAASPLHTPSPIDPADCAREAIHLPGAVQPHVALLAIDPVSLAVEACSANMADCTGLAPAAILGRPLREILPGVAVEAIVDDVGGTRLSVGRRPWSVKARLGDRACMVSAHGHAGRLIVEIEPLPDRLEDFAAAAPSQAQDAVARLRAAASSADAAQCCAEDLRAMTGFERVLIYRFDAGWNGEAVAESRGDGYPPLLGMRFPASDIPAQARALYADAPPRFIVDREAVPSPIVTAAGGDGKAIDLSFAYSRAISPVHLRYQRERGVNGSMSISILIGGALWGLVIGHHRQPHRVPPDIRALAGLVADAFALRIEAMEAIAALEQKEVLTREIDHRVKNSLQFVASILLLQTRRVADPDAKTAFRNAYGRVMSIARVHDSLRQSDSSASADLGETVRRLCDDLSNGIADAGYRIGVDAEEGLMVPSRTAVALAIIATELVSNALRYAYPAGDGGAIAVRVHAHGDGGIRLIVADEGCGLPDDWERRSRESGTLGLRVIEAMLEQIGATLSADAECGRGARFTVTV